MDDLTFQALKEYHYKITESLDGVEKMRFISGVFDDYQEVCALKYPLKERKKYRELFTELVKNFGH